MCLISEKQILLQLERRWFTPISTIGRITLNGKFICYSLEDPYRDLPNEEKVKHNTCIPYGTYNIILAKSPKRGYTVPWIQNVPYFTHIQIHPGNYPSDTSGCILPGLARGFNAIYESRKAFDKLMSYMGDDKFMQIAIVSEEFFVS